MPQPPPTAGWPAAGPRPAWPPYGPPGHGAPGYGPPGYAPPGYGPAGYPPPGYGPPGYGPPAYWAPAYGYGRPPRPGPAPGLEFASGGYRLLAALIEGVAQGAAVFAFFTAVGAAAPATTGATTGALLGAVAVLGFLAITIGFGVVIPGRLGATVGMLPFGMRILRDEDGGPIGYGRATGRWAAGTVPVWFTFGLFTIVSFLVVCFDRRHQAPHDKVCSTVVVKRPG